MIFYFCINFYEFKEVFFLILFVFMVMLMRKDNNREFSLIVKCLKSIYFFLRDFFLNLLEYIKYYKMVLGFNYSVLIKCLRLLSLCFLFFYGN